MDAPDGATLPDGTGLLEVTPLDGADRRVVYVALWSLRDIVEANYRGTGALAGADLNLGLSLPDSAPGVLLNAQLARHAQLIRNEAVVAEFLPYLDR